MTPFMERVAEVVTGGERGGSPGTRPSEPRPVVIGADEQVMTRALAEQLVSEANAVLVSTGPSAVGPGAAGDVIDLEDELGEGRLSFVMRYQERYARVSTSFAHRTSVGRLHGVGAGGTDQGGTDQGGTDQGGTDQGGADQGGPGEVALDGPEQLERLILLLLTQGQGGTSCNTSSASR